MRIRPESLFRDFKPGRSSLGGESSQGKRKGRRPFDPKQALHLILRSSKAKGGWSMLHPDHCRPVHEFTHRLAERWGVRIYRYANVGNHLHILVRARSRAVFQRFLRELAGGIAIIVSGARKGAPLARNASDRGFWDHLAFTRIVRFGRDFEGVMKYLVKNLFEAAGIPMERLLERGYRLISIRRELEDP